MLKPGVIRPNKETVEHSGHLRENKNRYTVTSGQLQNKRHIKKKRAIRDESTKAAETPLFVFELLMIQLIKSTFQVTEKDRTANK